MVSLSECSHLTVPAHCRWQVLISTTINKPSCPTIHLFIRVDHEPLAIMNHFSPLPLLMCNYYGFSFIKHIVANHELHIDGVYVSGASIQLTSPLSGEIPLATVSNHVAGANGFLRTEGVS